MPHRLSLGAHAIAQYCLSVALTTFESGWPLTMYLLRLWVLCDISLLLILLCTARHVTCRLQQILMFLWLFVPGRTVLFFAWLFLRLDLSQVENWKLKEVLAVDWTVWKNYFTFQCEQFHGSYKCAYFTTGGEKHLLCLSNIDNLQDSSLTNNCQINSTAGGVLVFQILWPPSVRRWHGIPSRCYIGLYSTCSEVYFCVRGVVQRSWCDFDDNKPMLVTSYHCSYIEYLYRKLMVCSEV